MRILTVVLTSALSVCAVAEATDEQEGRPGTPASVFLGQLDGVDLNDPLAVFGSVLTHLNREVVIYPTENYLYLRFFVGDQEFWGNIRLAVQERDHGLVHFTYYAFGNDLTSTQRLQRSRMLDRDAGVEVIKIDDFRYLVRFGNTEVTFLLNRVDQSPPALFRLAPSERVLFRLHDESNYRFFLIFDRETNALYYVLDEEYAPLIEEEWLNERVVIDPQSGFAFYVDAEQQERKILLGVSAEATRLNTYYDGPFDQLADNYIDESTMRWDSRR